MAGERKEHVLREMSLKEKISYIWEYYRWFIIGGIIGMGILISIIVSLVTPKPNNILNVCFINGNATTIMESGMEKDFMKAWGYDAETEEVMLDPGYMIDPNNSAGSGMYLQKLMAVFSVGGVDVVVADGPVLTSFSEMGGFVDLREVLPADLLEKYKDKLYYMKGGDGKEIAVGVYVTDSKVLKDSQAYLNIEPVAAITVADTNRETAIEYVQYLLGESK